MGVFFAAAVPAAALLLIVWLPDRHREQWRKMLLYALLGALVVLPAGVIEQQLLNLYGLSPSPPGSLYTTLVTAFFVAGVTEETLKGLVFLRFVYRDPRFVEPYEGVVYAVAISLGFGATENILYVASYGMSVAFVRAFTAIPAHALFGAVMGSRFSDAKFHNAPGYRAILIPAFLHGTYDALALADSFSATVLLAIFLMALARHAILLARGQLRDRPARRLRQPLSI